jgi:hypothetical protein
MRILAHHTELARRASDRDHRTMHRSRLLSLCTALACLGCADASGPDSLPLPPIVSLVTADSVAVVEGDSLQLSARVVTETGDTIATSRVAWVVDDTLVANVTGAGMLHFRLPGATRIVALAGGRTRPIRVVATAHYDSLLPGRGFCGVTHLGASVCIDDPGVSRSSLISTSLSGIAFSATHQCGLDNAGHAWCRGYDSTGHVGGAFVLVPGGRQFRSLAVGYQSSCGITPTDSLYCWGTGPLGDTTTGSRETPLPVTGGYPVRSVSIELSNACAVTAAATVICWGSNRQGQLGVPAATLARSLTPVAVPGVTGAVSVVVASLFACATTTTGAVLCWGTDFNHQFGRACSNACAAGAVGGGIALRKIVYAGIGTCGLSLAGTLYCWGGTTTLPTPFAAASFTDIGGAGTGCALRAAGTAMCWGYPWPATPTPVPFQ